MPPRPSSAPSPLDPQRPLLLLATLTKGLAELVKDEGTARLTRADLRAMIDPKGGGLRPEFLMVILPPDREAYQAWAQTNRNTILRLLGADEVATSRVH